MHNGKEIHKFIPSCALNTTTLCLNNKGQFAIYGRSSKSHCDLSFPNVKIMLMGES
jgi:hypothetical protein